MTKYSLLTGACLFSLCTASLPAMAQSASQQEIQALKAQLQAMSERLAALEAQQQAKASLPEPNTAPTTATTPLPSPHQQAASPKSPQVVSTAPAAVPGEGEAVVGGNFPGSFQLPGTKTSMKISGYAKLDAIADANHAYGSQFARFAAIPLDGTPTADLDGQFTMHARQSRLGVETHTPTELGELKTFIEVDFFGSANGNPRTTNGEGLQLRHAYGSVGHVLAGQTWSNFMDIDAYPESLDYVGPAGLTFTRQAQIRYTDTAGPLTYAFAVESPLTDFTSTTSTNVNLDDMPDLTGRLQYKDTFGHLALRGIVRHLKAASTVTREEDDDLGWGVGLSGKLLAFDKDSLSFQTVYGDGIGRYLFDVANSGNGVTFVNGEVEPQTAYGGYLAYQHFWAPAWRSNVILGYTGIDNDVALTGTGVNKEIASGHVNLIWSPFPSYRVGLEYMHGYREIESGTEGELDRVQGSFMYLF